MEPMPLKRDDIFGNSATREMYMSTPQQELEPSGALKKQEIILMREYNNTTVEESKGLKPVVRLLKPSA